MSAADLDLLAHRLRESEAAWLQESADRIRAAHARHADDRDETPEETR